MTGRFDGGGAMNGTLLALGLAVTPSTQLRFGASPIGPGEMLLVTWLALAIARHMLCAAVIANRAFRRVAAFWLIMVVVLPIGMIEGFVLEPFQDYVGIAHDIFAYVLMIAVSCMMALDLGFTGAAERRRVVWRIVGFGAVSMLLQIATAQGLISVPGVDPWYYDRLTGWADDPNMLALFALILAVLAVYLAETARNISEVAAALALGAPPIVVGILSQSDSFTVALMMASAVFLALKSICWLQTVEMGPTLRGATVVLGLLSLPLSLAAAIPFWSAAVEHVEQSSDDMYAKDDQGKLRLSLWHEAIEKGMASGMIGFGPGPHLTQKSYKRPPPDKFEAHNVPLQLLTQGGFVAAATFVWLCACTMVDCWRARLPALAALIASLSAFSMFHFEIRHPIFWFGIVLCLLEAARSLETEDRRVFALGGKPAL
jgi:hypothetical protein